MEMSVRWNVVTCSHTHTHTRAYIAGQFSCVGGVHDVRSVWDRVVVMKLLFTFPVADLRPAEEVKKKRRSYSNKTNINKSAVKFKITNIDKKQLLNTLVIKTERKEAEFTENCCRETEGPTL